MSEVVTVVTSSFEAARSAHVALIAAAVALLLVSVLPSDRAKYLAAKQELDALYDVMSSSIDDLYTMARVEAEAAVASHQKTLLAAAAAAGIDVQPNIQAADWIPWHYEKPGTSLAEAARFFSRPDLLVFVPNAGELEQGLNAMFETVRGQATMLLALRPSPFDELTPDAQTITLNAEFGDNDIVARRVESVEIGGRVRRLAEPDAGSWLAERTAQVALVSGSEAARVIFPKLRSIWSEVRAKDIDQATELVNTRIANAGRAVTIFGLSLQEEVIAVVAPGLLLVSILYLYAHVLHLRRLGRLEPTTLPEIAQRFPWLAMYPEKLAIALAIASIVALPLGTGMWVLARFTTCKSVQFWVGVLAMLAGGWAAAMTISDLRRIRQAT